MAVIAAFSISPHMKGVPNTGRAPEPTAEAVSASVTVRCSWHLVPMTIIRVPPSKTGERPAGLPADPSRIRVWENQVADLSRVHSLSYRSRMFWGNPA